MDTAFLVLVGINLCFLSALIVYRMRAGGVSARRIALPVVELWVAFALWIGIFGALSARIGSPAGDGAVGELGQLGQSIAQLAGLTRGWALGGVGIAVALLAHLVWTLGRVMRG